MKKRNVFIIFIFFISLVSIGFINSIEVGDVGEEGVNFQSTGSINYSQVNVNNSDFLDSKDSTYFYPNSNPSNYVNTSANLTNVCFYNESGLFNKSQNISVSSNYAFVVENYPTTNKTFVVRTSATAGTGRVGIAGDTTNALLTIGQNLNGTQNQRINIKIQPWEAFSITGFTAVQTVGAGSLWASPDYNYVLSNSPITDLYYYNGYTFGKLNTFSTSISTPNNYYSNLNNMGIGYNNNPAVTETIPEFFSVKNLEMQGGTVNTTAGSAIVRGSGTNFSKFNVGDEIFITGNKLLYVSSVSNATYMTMNDTASYNTSFSQIARAKGDALTIDTGYPNATINLNGNTNIANNLTVSQIISTGNMTILGNHLCNASNCYTFAELVNTAVSGGGMNYTNVALTNQTNVFTEEQNFTRINQYYNGPETKRGLEIVNYWNYTGVPEVNKILSISSYAYDNRTLTSGSQASTYANQLSFNIYKRTSNVILDQSYVYSISVIDNGKYNRTNAGAPMTQRITMLDILANNNPTFEGSKNFVHDMTGIRILQNSNPNKTTTGTLTENIRGVWLIDGPATNNGTLNFYGIYNDMNRVGLNQSFFLYNLANYNNFMGMNNSKTYFGDVDSVGVGASSISFDGTNMKIIPNETRAGSILYVTTNLSAENLIDRSWYWDKSIGNSLDYVKDSEQMKTAEGKVSDTQLHDFERAEYQITDYSRPLTQEIIIYDYCYYDKEKNELISCFSEKQMYDDKKEIEVAKPQNTKVTTYPYTKTETGRLVSATIGKHEQNIFDLIQEVNNLKSENTKIKDCAKNSKDFEEYKICVGGMG